jgi:hypothetical protein
MVGGSIADIWTPSQCVAQLHIYTFKHDAQIFCRRGLPMSMFSVCAIGGTGIGPVVGGWIEANRHMGWRWIQWINVMYDASAACWTTRFTCLGDSSSSGANLVAICLIMKETRSSIILTRLARKQRKETGDNRYRAQVEDEYPGLKTLIYISCTRPLCKSFGTIGF